MLRLFDDLQRYHAISKADKYIIGFTYKNNVYMLGLLDDIPLEFIAIEKASKNQGDAFRLRIKSETKKRILKNAECLGSVEILCDNNIKNKGDIFEKIVYEKYHGEGWTKDCKCFTEGGDVQVNGYEVQVKFEKATIVNEKTLNRQWQMSIEG